jgi:hypothetical protein
MKVSPPRVFISYSHDSAEHKKWVLDFATTLRNRGVDAVLDQWELKPGDDLPQFMEQNLAAADYAIMVCTPRYVKKANAGEGGVGYEKMIMTSASLAKISENKVIPIIREKGNPATPTFLQTKLYIDFSKDAEVEFALDDLLRHLLKAPLYQKPAIGKSPFKPMAEARPQPTADGVRQVMEDVASAYDHQYASLDFIMLNELQKTAKLRRLTLEKYLKEAEKMGLLSISSSSLRLTSQGRQYLSDTGIVEA